MLDIGRQEISLHAKRRELIGQIAEGRAVVATLVERHDAMSRKIEEATAGIRRLEEQLAAMNTVMKVFDDEGLILTQEPAARMPLRVAAEQAEPAEPAAVVPMRRHNFKPIEYLRCLSEGHQLTNSRAAPGYVTCTRCRVRRRM